MKRTITIAALAISASASAFYRPVDPATIEHKTYCLELYEDAQANKIAGACDQSTNNQLRHVQIGENGCAADQVALTTSKRRGQADFAIVIPACMPPNVAQL